MTEKAVGQMVNLSILAQVGAAAKEAHGYSAHADRDGLLRWVQTLRGERLRRVYVVHGEEAESQALAEGLRALGGLEVYVPRLGEAVEL